MTKALVQPSSVDVRVDSKFRVFHNARYPYIDVRQPMEDLTELVEVGEDEPFILHPGEFVLGQTLECDHAARRHRRAARGQELARPARPADPLDRRLRRRRLLEGNLTLELSNVANLPITIYHGMPIGQISFMRMDGPVERPYGVARDGLEVPGPGGADAQPLLPQLRQVGTTMSGYMWTPGPLELVIVLVVVLVIFGPKRLPELGRSLGRACASSRTRSPARTTSSRFRRTVPRSPSRTAAATPSEQKS